MRSIYFLNQARPQPKSLMGIFYKLMDFAPSSLQESFPSQPLCWFQPMDDTPTHLLSAVHAVGAEVVFVVLQLMRTTRWPFQLKES